jgi:hypothetical protein
MKLKPFENWIGDDQAITYIAIRADEPREGYISTKPNIKAKFPFKEAGVDYEGVKRILATSGVGLPDYYEWRTRSGCYFCFFQRKAEWVGLAERHPDLFRKSVEYEGKASFEATAMEGRQYTWSQGETLIQLIHRKDEIVARHQQAMARESAAKRPAALIDVLAEVLDEEDDSLPCQVCNL